jgi:hypothetical protein
MRLIRENYLVAENNYPLYPAGQPVFISSTTKRSPTIAVQPGQLVIYDPTTNLSVDPATANKANLGRFVMAVGVDLTGNGTTDQLRKAFGDVVYGCHIYGYNAVAPRCGLEEIVDVTMKCTEFNGSYTINVTVDNDYTQDMFPFNRKAVYTFTVDAESVPVCSDCGTEHNCDVVARHFVKLMNREISGDVRLNGTIYPINPPAFDPIRGPKEIMAWGFKAALIRNNRYEFCINPIQDGSCTDCVFTDGIRGMTINGVAPVVFSLPTFNATTGLTRLGQLELVVEAINQALAANGDEDGRAYLVKGVDAVCCPYRIEINTDLVITNLLGPDATTYAPCASETDILDEGVCGIRIVGATVPIECNPYAPSPPRINFINQIDAHLYGGFESTGSSVTRIQSASSPEGLGYYFQYAEYMSATGGEGRTHDDFHDKVGNLMLPTTYSAAASVKTKCRETYCVYTISQRLPNMNVNPNGTPNVASGRTVVLIPSVDTVTRASFETFMNAYVTDGSCGVLEAQTCGEISEGGNGDNGDNGEPNGEG